ncbi:hypothetical protein [Segetibacter aerophilus]|uniref:Uncharacterized protein n=1 Tax=Segetibacter aerophilus TaxID=670293 RepID=A0A512BAI0_9BACT|nr:hypothetical protein [Segetibacter aerophilus]GEO08960.1 hypothetical protein SAE01_14560 [Segetibacter aerophilus]
MKRVFGFIGVCLFTFSVGFSQDNKKLRSPRPLEQQEIKADQRIEKEIQQKQLSSKPEMLEPSIGKDQTGKASPEKANKKRKYAKKSCAKVK